MSRDNLVNGAGLGYSGAYYNKELQRVSTDGLWWSSTVNETRYAYDLGINKDGNYLIPQNFNNAKYYGRAVRCKSYQGQLMLASFSIFLVLRPD